MGKRALILGVGGQDGSYLAEILLESGYEVHGLVRHSSGNNLWRIRHLLDKITLHKGDICDGVRLAMLIDELAPDEIYNEADQDSVGWSGKAPGYQIEVTYKAVSTILETLRYMGGKVRFFQPVSSTMFGDQPYPHTETTPLKPQSPYACAKAAAFLLCQHYRREHGVYVSCGILYNHDSPRRGPDYLLQRIARGEPLWGDLSTIVDVGYAPEYMEAAYQSLQQSESRDYVIATGRGYRIADLQNWAKGLTGEPEPEFKQLAYPVLPYDCQARRILGFAPKHDALSVLKILKAERDKS